MIIHALQTSTPFVYEIFRISYCIRSKCTSDKYFLFKWSTCLQSIYNHMVGRTASLISPFYSLLPGISHGDFWGSRENVANRQMFKIRLSYILIIQIVWMQRYHTLALEFWMINRFFQTTVVFEKYITNTNE